MLIHLGAFFYFRTEGDMGEWTGNMESDFKGPGGINERAKAKAFENEERRKDNRYKQNRKDA